MNDTAAMGSNETAEIIRRFNDVFLNHDPSALPELIADHCVIENTQPAPDGARQVGREACIATWKEIATTPGTHFTSTSKMLSLQVTAQSSDGATGGARVNPIPCGASI
jgi:hypothetical protein